MSTLPSLAGIDYSVPSVPVRRFTVEEYHQLIQKGILKQGERCELLEGWIVEKMTRNPPHDYCLGALEDKMTELLTAGWFRRGQSGLTTAESVPEPDLAVVRGRRSDFIARHPGPTDLGMVVEVADTSLAADRTVKARIYARAGIPIYWIVNIPETRVEVYTDPSGPVPEPVYRQRRDYLPIDNVPLILDGQQIGQVAVADLLP